LNKSTSAMSGSGCQRDPFMILITSTDCAGYFPEVRTPWFACYGILNGVTDVFFLFLRALDSGFYPILLAPTRILVIALALCCLRTRLGLLHFDFALVPPILSARSPR
jgi:hypothetical protein